MQIVKVRYIFKDGTTQSPREYTYFSEEELKIGDHVLVPVRDRFDNAIVTIVDVPLAEIEAFKDKVKTIPAGSIAIEKLREATQGGPYGAQEWPQGELAPPGYGHCPHGLFRLDQGCPICTGKARKEREGKAPAQEAKELLERVSEPLDVVNEPAEDVEEDGLDILQDITNGTKVALAVAPDKNAAALDLYEQGKKLQALAELREIKNDQDVKSTAEDLAIIAGVVKKLTELRKIYEAPFKEHLASFRTAFDNFIEPLLRAEQVNKKKWAAYRETVAVAARKAEQENLAKEAAAIKEAQESGGTGEIKTDLTPVVAPKTADTVRTAVGTSSAYKTPKYRVVDFANLPDDYKMPDAGKLTRVIKAAKGQIDIPGVEIWFEDVFASRPKTGGS